MASIAQPGRATSGPGGAHGVWPFAVLLLPGSRVPSHRPAHMPFFRAVRQKGSRLAGPAVLSESINQAAGRDARFGFWAYMPDKPCPLIAITGRYCLGLCSSSRSSNAAAAVAFLRPWLATRWPGLDTLASRQSPGTASGPIRPWASWRGCHLPFGVLQGLASRSRPVRIATGSSPCLRFSHPARRWVSDALTR